MEHTVILRMFVAKISKYCVVIWVVNNVKQEDVSSRCLTWCVAIPEGGDDGHTVVKDGHSNDDHKPWWPQI